MWTNPWTSCKGWVAAPESNELNQFRDNSVPTKSLISTPEREPGPASAEVPGRPTRIVFTLHSGCRITGPTDGAPDGALNGALSKVPNGTARGPSWRAQCSTDSKAKPAVLTRAMTTSMVCNLISSIGATTPLRRGGDISARVRWAIVFFHGQCSCKHTRLPTPWLAWTIWVRKNLMQKRTRRTDKILKILADRTGPSILPKFRRWPKVPNSPFALHGLAPH